MVDGLELLLGDIAVIALELLFGAKLLAIVGQLATATLAVLARSVFALILGALGRECVSSFVKTPKPNRAFRGRSVFPASAEKTY